MGWIRPLIWLDSAPNLAKLWPQIWLDSTLNWLDFARLHLCVTLLIRPSLGSSLVQGIQLNLHSPLCPKQKLQEVSAATDGCIFNCSTRGLADRPTQWARLCWGSGKGNAHIAEASGCLQVKDYDSHIITIVYITWRHSPPVRQP